MSSKYIRIFIETAGAMLLAAAFILFASSWTNTYLVQPYEPISLISMRRVFLTLGGLGLVVGSLCLFCRPGKLQLWLILWVAADLLLYRLGLASLNVSGGFRGFLAGVAAPFMIPPDLVNALSYFVIFFWLIGSILSLMALKTKGLASDSSLAKQKDKFLKMPCFFCKKDVEFSARATGEKMPCPHCKMDITLKEPA